MGADTGAADHPCESEIGLFINRSVAIAHYDSPNFRILTEHLAKDGWRVAVDSPRHFHHVRSDDAKRTKFVEYAGSLCICWRRFEYFIFQRFHRFGDDIAAGAMGRLGRKQQEGK